MNATRKWFIAFFVFVTAVRVFFAAHLGLGDDEAYYWEWTTRPALSYYDHPPMTAWVGWLSCTAFGDNELGFRFGTLVCSAVFTLFLFLLARRLWGTDRAALFSAIFVSCVPLFAAGAFMMVPDAPLSAFWIASLYVFQRIVATRRPSYWYLLGGLFGLGLLSKYNMALLPLCVLLYCALSREDRFWLRRKEPYLALLLGAALFAPVIFWNAEHGFASFAYHLSSRNKYDLTWTPFLIYLGGQFLYLSPMVYPAAVAGMVAAAAAAIRKQDRMMTFVACFSVPYFALFSIACALSPTSKPHWPVMAYIPVLMWLASALDAALSKRDRARLWILSVIWAPAFLMSAFLYVQSVYPVVKLEGSSDPTNELYGWDVVGQALNGEMASLGSPDSTFIFAMRYNVASQLAFYTGGRYRIYSINPKREQYDYWGRGCLDGLEGQNALFVSDDRYTSDLTQEYAFETVERLEPIVIRRGGRAVKRVYIARCHNYRGKRST